MGTEAGDALHARMLLITQGPLPTVMKRLVVPSALWYLLNYAFFVVDAYFVGRLGTTQLAAMSLICAVLALTMTLAQGVGAALAAITSVYLGARMTTEAARLVTHTFVLGLLVAVALAALGLPTIDVLFGALGAKPEQLPFIRAFMPTWYVGFVFVMLSTVGQSAMRATGDVKTPLLLLLGIGGINTLLDPILMYGYGPVPELGVRGVALAGVASRAIGAIIAVSIVAKRDRLLRLYERSQMRASWTVIARIAGPVVVQMMALAVSSAIMLRIAGNLGTEILAGVGVGIRIDAILSALVLGLPIVLPTFIGQNAGAGNPLRAGQGILIGMRQVVIAQAVIALVLSLFAHTVSRAFSSDPRIQQTLQLFLLIVPVGHTAYTLLTTTAGTLIALGRMRSYMIIGIVPCFVSVIVAWVGARLFGVPGLIAAFPIARAGAGIIAWGWVKGELRTAGFLAAPTPIVAPAS